MDVRGFLAQLKTRGVYRVAAFYIAGSWALLQVADVAFPIIGLPDWAITTLLAGAALGFPIALLLAWLFDLSPRGITETDAAGAVPGARLLSPARVVELAILLTLALLVGFLYLERISSGQQGWPSLGSLWSDDRRPAVAVMAFSNLSGDPSVDYLGDGVAEEILNLLSRLGELDVAARSSSFRYRGQDVDLREVGRNLGVSHVLEGSVRRSQERVRVTAQLVDTNTGYRLWSETFDRDYDDSFRIQDAVARQVVSNLELMLSQRSQEILAGRPAPDPEAYDYYLRGRDYLRATPSRASLDSAIALFRRARERDADYASAHAGLCDAYLERYRLERDTDDFAAAQAHCERALSLARDVAPVHVALAKLYQASGRLGESEGQFREALALDPDGADALTGLARTYYLDNRLEQAEETYRRAIDRHPNDWRAHSLMGAFLFQTGRFDEAVPYYRRITELVPDDAQAVNGLAASYYLQGNLEEAAAAFRRSLALEPNALAYANTGSSLFFLGRFEEALEMYLRAVELAPEDFQHWGALADAYHYSAGEKRELAAPMYDNAIRLARAHVDINPQDASTHSLLAHYQSRRSDREAALQSVARALTLAPKDMYVHYNCALALTTLGDRQRAVELLQRAVELGYTPRLVRLDIGLEPLRGMARFDRLVAGP